MTIFRNIKSIFIMSLLINIAAVLPAISLTETNNDLSVLSNLWLNRELTDSETTIRLINLEKDISAEFTGFEEYYLSAKTALFKGMILFYSENQSESIPILEKSKNFALKAASIKNDSDAWRVAAEAGSMVMVQKGLPYIIKNAGKIQDYIDQALEFNPDNARAAVLNAQAYINAPAIFGGDAGKGITILEDILKNNMPDEDRFFALFYLSTAYDKKRKPEMALAAAEKAKKIFPENPQIFELMKEL